MTLFYKIRFTKCDSQIYLNSNKIINVYFMSYDILEFY